MPHNAWINTLIVAWILAFPDIYSKFNRQTDAFYEYSNFNFQVFPNNIDNFIHPQKAQISQLCHKLAFPEFSGGQLPSCAPPCLLFPLCLNPRGTVATSLPPLPPVSMIGVLMYIFLVFLFAWFFYVYFCYVERSVYVLFYFNVYILVLLISSWFFLCYFIFVLIL